MEYAANILGHMRKIPVNGHKSTSQSSSKKKGTNRNSSKNRREDATKQANPFIKASHLH